MIQSPGRGWEKERVRIRDGPARALEKTDLLCHPRLTVFATCAAHFRGQFGTVPVLAEHGLSLATKGEMA
jgi:hypothetical protein